MRHFKFITCALYILWWRTPKNQSLWSKRVKVTLGRRHRSQISPRCPVRCGHELGKWRAEPGDPVRPSGLIRAARLRQEMSAFFKCKSLELKRQNPVEKAAIPQITLSTKNVIIFSLYQQNVLISRDKIWWKSYTRTIEIKFLFFSFN